MRNINLSDDVYSTSHQILVLYDTRLATTILPSPPGGTLSTNGLPAQTTF